MPDGLRPSTSPATRFPELAPTELEVIRKLLGHSMETVEREFHLRNSGLARWKSHLRC